MNHLYAIALIKFILVDRPDRVMNTSNFHESANGKPLNNTLSVRYLLRY